MMRMLLFWRSATIMMTLLAVSFIIIVVNVYNRQLGAPVILRYAPPDASGVIYVPSVEKAWRVVESHTAHLFPNGLSCDEFYEGPIAEAFRMMACEIEDVTGLTIFDAEDTYDELSIQFGDEDACAGMYDDVSAIEKLRAYGLDIDKSMLFASRGPLAASDFVLVFSVHDKNCFRRAADIWMRDVDVAAFQIVADRPEALTQKVQPVKNAVAALAIETRVSPAPALQTSGRAVDYFSPEHGYSMRLFPVEAPCSVEFDQSSITWGPENITQRKFFLVTKRDLIDLDSLEVTIYFHADDDNGEASAQTSAYPIVMNAKDIRSSVVINGKSFEIGLAGPAVCYAMAEDGITFLFSDFELFQTSILNNNRAHPIVFERSFRDAMKHFTEAEGALKAWAYLKQPGVYFGAPIVAAFSGEEQFLHARIRIATHVEGSDLLTRFVGNPRPSGSKIHSNGSGLFTFTYYDQDIGKMLTELAGLAPNASDWINDYLRNSFSGRYRGIYDVLLDTKNINALQLDIIKEPEVGAAPVLAVSAAPQEAEEIVFALQSEQRFSRDSEIVSAALKVSGIDVSQDKGIRKFTPTEYKNTLQTLIASGAIAAEDNELFDRLAEQEYKREDFDNSNYCGCLNVKRDKFAFQQQNFICAATTCESAVSYKYVFPPVTDNDMRYRYTDEAISDAFIKARGDEESEGYAETDELIPEEPIPIDAADLSVPPIEYQAQRSPPETDEVAVDESVLTEIREKLRKGHYRMTAAYDDNISALILAPHLIAAETVVSRPTGVRLDNGVADRLAPANDAITRLTLVANPKWVTEELQLSADENYRDIGRQYSSEVSLYRRAEFIISSSNENGGLIIDVGISK